MQIPEFSHQFSTLLNSHALAAGYGNTDNPATIELDEYEKSLFLTNAQEEIALSLYSGRNSSLQSFEETEELRRYLSSLVCEAELDPIETSNGKPLGIDSNSKFFILPDGTEEPAVWFITYEAVTITKGNVRTIPICK